MDYEFYVYDQIMYGNIDLLKSAFFKTKKSEHFLYETRALKVIKYAIEEYLRWTPEEVYKKLDEKIVANMWC